MKAHYTKFETEEQFNELAEKAGQLGKVDVYWDGDNVFGFDQDIPCFMAYGVNDETVVSEYYQSATYLPYTEYLEYLDNCIKEKDNGEI